MRNYTTETVIPVLSHISHYCHADCHTVTNCDTGSTNHSSHQHSQSNNNANRACHHGLYDTNFSRNRKTRAKFREECHWDVKLGPPSEMMTVAVILKYFRYFEHRQRYQPILKPVILPPSLISVCLTEGGEYSDAATLLVGIPPSCSSQWRCALCSHLHNGQSSICWLNDIGPPCSEPQLGLEEESAAVSQGILMWAGLYQGLDQWQKKGVALSAFPDSQGERLIINCLKMCHRLSIVYVSANTLLWKYKGFICSKKSWGWHLFPWNGANYRKDEKLVENSG